MRVVEREDVYDGRVDVVRGPGFIRVSHIATGQLDSAEDPFTFAAGDAIRSVAKLSVWASSEAMAAKGGAQGGLNLFKWGAPQTTKATGWKSGDYMLHLPNKGTPALNWKANYEALRSSMKLGKPIFDSYRLPNGNLIPTGGFLNVERSILQGRGWIYNSSRGAWLPPGY